MARTMLGLEFLEGVAEEREGYKGGLYDLHARAGVTMEDIVDLLRSPDPDKFDGEAVLEKAREWAGQVVLQPGMRDTVLAAVQAVLHGESFRARGAARTRRCVACGGAWRCSRRCCARSPRRPASWRTPGA